MKFSSFSINNMPDKKWLIDGLIGEKEVGILYGKSGSGKTFVAIDLMMSAVDGKHFAGKFNLDRPLTVAIATGEGGLALKKRIVAAREFHNTKNGDNAQIFVNGLRFYDDEHIASFVEEWKRFENRQLDLLIVDTLSAAMGGNDDASGREMGVVFQRARYLADELGCTVLFVHHPRKNDSEFRGSGKIMNDVDFMIQVDNKTMSCRKLKDEEMFLPIKFDLQKFQSSLVVKWEEGGSLKNQIFAFIENEDNPVTMDQIVSAFKSEASHMTIKNAVKEMVEEGLFYSRLRNPSAKGSKSNPTIYFLNSEVIAEVEEW